MNPAMKRRKARERKRNLKFAALLLISAVLLIYVITIGFNTSNVKGEIDNSSKCYITVAVNRGDTLWSIADKYLDDRYDTHESFIKEVTKINDIHNELIYAGEYLVIPVFDKLP